jgi:hypothetical protein
MALSVTGQGRLADEAVHRAVLSLQNGILNQSPRLGLLDDPTFNLKSINAACKDRSRRNATS